MSSCQLVFTTSDSLISRLIQFITHSHTSHVGIHIDGRVFSAELTGVVEQSLESFLAGRSVVQTWETHAEYGPSVSATSLRAMVGVPYDYLGILGAIIPILSWLWFRRKLHNPFASPKAFVCSEFVVRKVRAFEFRELDPETTSPKGILRALKRGKSFVRVGLT